MKPHRYLRWGLFNSVLILHITAELHDSATQQPLAESSTTNHYPPLNFSSHNPYIFHSTFSLLQQWPNTFFPAGHTIAPCTIPRNTNLYHAHANGSFPPSPEWSAFDSAMAYAILGGFSDSHLLTYRTTRDVKCLYFDGTSAALQYDGSMDSQNLFLHNNSANVPDDPVFGDHPPWIPRRNYSYPYRPYDNGSDFYLLGAEYKRAAGLCKFLKEKRLGGLGWGYEGIVRMNEGFELIWCNFSSPSAELVSWLNVSAPSLVGVKQPRVPGRGPLSVFDRPFTVHAMFEWFRTATQAYGFVGGVPGNGEVRVKISSCGLFSFYDPALVDQSHARVLEDRKAFNLSSKGHWLGPKNKNDSRNVALQQLVRRGRYRLASNVSEADGLYMRSEMEKRMHDTLSPEESTCSDIDWVFTTQTIVTDYSSPLYDLQRLLMNATTTDLSNKTIVQRHLSVIRGSLHQFSMPYYTYPDHFTNESLHEVFSPISQSSLAALDRCKNQHTPVPTTTLSTSEKITLDSILDVLGVLCSTLLPLFLSTEILWLEHFNNVTAHHGTLPPFLQYHVNETMTRNLDALDELMAWLGWIDQWTNCDPGCNPGHVCAIPMWPIAMGVEPGEDREEILWRGGRCVGLADTLLNFRGF